AEPEGGAVEIFLACELEAERTHVRRARLPQHDRMVVALLDAAQMQRFISLVADQEPETVDIKGARTRNVAHPQFHMARPHYIERRVENGFSDRHSVSQR